MKSKITVLFLFTSFAFAQFNENVVCGADQMDFYLSRLNGKRIGIVTNQTGVVKNEKGQYVHLVDTLKSLGIRISKIFAPEHGFRGKADAGEAIKNGFDEKTGIRVISLYGKNKKPKREHLKDVDIIVFDIQDVGVRFYTYLSTLHYVMEACAENTIPIIVFDRPNPNGFYIDGSVLDTKNSSFVGLHPVPIVYGMTIAEYAKMINGKRWLNFKMRASLTIVPLKNYNRKESYKLPVHPSPNLRSHQSIMLYPSLALFEGTQISVGRGTEIPFEIYGAPFLPDTNYPFVFIPSPNEGSKHPPHQGEICYGEKLSDYNVPKKLQIQWLLKTYHHAKNKTPFFNSFFTKLSGVNSLQKQIEQGMSEEQIRQSWGKELATFKSTRDRYLIY